MAIKLQAAPLPSNFKGTPQQLLEAFLDRLVITSDETTFVISDTQPAGNEGPWFKNGNKIYTWDEGTSTYVALDISDSYKDEWYVGESAPNPDDQKFWLKISGTDILGVYYYMGSTAGWVTQDLTIPDGSLTTEKFSDQSITTAKLKNLSVTTAKLANGISLSKVEAGLPYQFLRMDSTGSVVGWESNFIESEEIAWSAAMTRWAHGLTETPRSVTAILVCKTTDVGWEAGDELDAFSVICDTAGDQEKNVAVWKNATYVGLSDTGSTLLALTKAGGSGVQTIDRSKWKIKFQVQTR